MPRISSTMPAPGNRTLAGLSAADGGRRRPRQARSATATRGRSRSHLGRLRAAGARARYVSDRTPSRPGMGLPTRRSAADQRGAVGCLGIEGPHRQRRRVRAHLRRRPPPRGHPGGPGDPRPRARARDVLPRRRAGAAHPRARSETEANIDGLVQRGLRRRRRRLGRQPISTTSASTPTPTYSSARISPRRTPMPGAPRDAGGGRIGGRGEIAQLVEHATENCGVLGSSPSLAIARRGSVGVLDHDPSPLSKTRRYPPVSAGISTPTGASADGAWLAKALQMG